MQTDGDSGNFCLSDGERILPISKHCCMIADFIAFDGNDKRFANKLIQHIQTLLQSNLQTSYYEALGRMAALLDCVQAETDFALDYDAEDCASGILKALRVRLSDDGTLLEQLVNFMRASAELLQIRHFVFVSLKSLLNDQDLALLYRQARLEEWSLLLIEQVAKPKIESERHYILDRDLCEIVVPE